MWSVIFTFAAAVAVIYLSYLCSKYVGKTMNRSSSSTYMKLVDQIVLGQDRHIAVVEVGEKYLLVGITAGQINILTTLTKEELIPLADGQEEGKTPATPEFRKLLEKLNHTKKER
jgi:flagellar protein FliO/FliZ|nr:flagellar biosynthetic protein FliO [uncultured Faecalimonas sp.]